MWRNGKASGLWVGMQTGTAAVSDSTAGPPTLPTQIHQRRSSNLTSGSAPMGTESRIPKILHTHVHSNIIHNQAGKSPKCSLRAD